jgi:hypothetical protein
LEFRFLVGRTFLSVSSSFICDFVGQAFLPVALHILFSNHNTSQVGALTGHGRTKEERQARMPVLPKKN